MKLGPGANFIELLKHEIARFVYIYTCYWQKCHAIYIVCDWYLAVVYLA